MPEMPEMPRTTIEKLSREEINDVLISRVTELFADLVISGAALGWVDPPPKLEIADLITQLVSESASATSAPRASTVVARSESGAVVGMAYWRRYARPTHRVHADLERLAVAREWQGQGIGARLLGACVETARSAGIEQLTLDSRGDNATAIRMWESCGFVQYGRLPDFVAVGATRYDKTFWVLDLR
jgi:ribosomal protein S18 acetylase RimI-like enzyme